jgi:uncharacterized protein DUF2442
MYPVVTSVTVIPPYGLRLTFDDNTSGDIDCRPWLFEREDGLFAELRDPALFAMVWVDHEADTVVWPNGADVAPETLYQEAHRRAAG